MKTDKLQKKVREVLSEWFKKQRQITESDGTFRGYMITKNQEGKIKRQLWRNINYLQESNQVLKSTNECQISRLKGCGKLFDFNKKVCGKFDYGLCEECSPPEQDEQMRIKVRNKLI